MEVPHVYASSLMFYLGSGTSPITSAYVSSSVRLEASIVNNGQSAASNLLVSFYLDNATSGKLIGSVKVASLAVSATTTVMFNWTAQSVSGQGVFQNRTVYVVFDKYTKSTDTPVSQMFEVIDNRPDTAVVDGAIIKAGTSTHSASPGEGIKVSFNVTNLGMTTATNAQVLVNLTAGSTNYVIYNSTVTLRPGETSWINASWVVSGVSMGTYNMNIWVNPAVTFEEGDMSNNHMVIEFTVATIVSPTITIIPSATEPRPGDTIIVQGNSDQQVRFAAREYHHHGVIDRWSVCHRQHTDCKNQCRWYLSRCVGRS